MPNEIKPKTMAEIPMQQPPAPTTGAEARGRYFNSANAFNLVLPPVPDTVFQDEPAAALADGAPTGFTLCDLSRDLDNDTPATTPLLLARYARINAGDSLDADFETAGSIWYVIEGHGRADTAGETITWGPGDVFVMPGGASRMSAGTENAVLWVVTNEPQMRFEDARAPDAADSTVDFVHFTAAEIDRQIEQLYAVDPGDDTAGIALIFSSEKQMGRRNITPTMTLAMNTLPPGDHQRAHRHNSVAVTLVVQGEGCFSVVDEQRKDWTPWATTVTPPTSFHAHFNDGDQMAKFLIVQDGGLYYHARTMGFSFD